MKALSRYFLCSTIFFSFLSPAVFGQSDSSDHSIIDSIITQTDIFALSEPAEITLKFNIQEYRHNENSDEYLPAQLTYHLGDSLADRHLEVRIKARGKSRKEICSFPPFNLNIKKADVQNKNLQEVKEIKIATHCNYSSMNESYLLKEFLVYKIYNIISPYSFNVRLVKMRYIDTGKKDKVTETWAFMIEPESLLADRLDMFSVKLDHLGLAHLDTTWARVLTVFQFMIGNADFSVLTRHNLKLLKLKDYTALNPIPVPYDFDYCGLVNAAYAIPGENLGLESVKERYFLGLCADVETYLTTMEVFFSAREEIYALINDFEYLSENNKRKMIRYLDEFYIIAEHKRSIQNSMLKTCR